jgi:short-subunit dehydrogenase
MQCCHHFGKQMRARGKGGILLVNSYACYGGGSSLSIYSASKAFDLCLAESLWTELRPHGVHVLSLVMSMTDTPAFNALLAEKGLPKPPGVAEPDAVAELGLARLPFGPVQNWGLEDEAAGAAPMSAASRRSRIIAIDEMSAAVFGKK